jgi:hypothetical protein
VSYAPCYVRAKAGDLSNDEALKRLERSPYWVWTAIVPASKLPLVIDIGMRTAPGHGE